MAICELHISEIVGMFAPDAKAESDMDFIGVFIVLLLTNITIMQYCSYIGIMGFWPQNKTIYFLTVRQYWLSITKPKNVFFIKINSYAILNFLLNKIFY